MFVLPLVFKNVCPPLCVKMFNPLLSVRKLCPPGDKQKVTESHNVYIYIWCVSELGNIFNLRFLKKIFCGGHCVKSIYPREKVKYVPDR